MHTSDKTPVLLTIAGSDCSGGAGVQADLKTFTTLGGYGTSVITSVVAENFQKVLNIESVQSTMVREQLECIFDVFTVSALKTGMLCNNAIVEVVCRFLNQLPEAKRPHLVVDPVMISTSGNELLQKKAIQKFKSDLLPMASLVTPNLPEAIALGCSEINTEKDAREAANKLSNQYNVPFLIKGGHLQGNDEAVDFLCIDGFIHEFRTKRIDGIESHGSGCTYSAAMVAYLGRGLSLVEAVRRAKAYMQRAFEQSVRIDKMKALNHLPDYHL